MNDTGKKARPLRTALLILLALLLLIAVFPFLYSLVGGFRDYDDIPALIAADGVRPLTVEKDGTVCFAADKAAVYAYADRAGIREQLTAAIAQLPFCNEKTAAFRKFGYTLGDGVIGASAKLRLFGFLPVQLHADATLQLAPEEIGLQLTKLQLGKWISLPLDRLADTLAMPELTDGFVIDTSELYGELYPLAISAGDDKLSFRCNVLNETIGSIGASGTAMARLTPLLDGNDTDAAKVLRQQTAKVYAAVKDTDALAALLTELLRFGSEENAAAIKPALEQIPFLSLSLGDVADCAASRSAALAETLAGYEAELIALRDNYKEMNYRLAKDGLYDADGARAEAALPAAWGARTVLQYNMDYNSIVKANDGSLSPTGTWIELPNPKLSDLKRDAYSSLPQVPGITVFDLTVALRLADGTPAILFLTAADEVGINVISEELYGDILDSETLPVYCSSDVIAPNVSCFVTPEKTQRDLVLYHP